MNKEIKPGKIEKLYKYYLDYAVLLKVTYITTGILIFISGVIFSVAMRAFINNSIISQYLPNFSLGNIPYTSIALYAVVGALVALIGFKKAQDSKYKAYMLKETHEIHEKLFNKEEEKDS